MVKKDGYYTVIGVVSAGIGCARPLLPGVYTHVSSHMDWITETIESSWIKWNLNVIRYGIFFSML